MALPPSPAQAGTTLTVDATGARGRVGGASGSPGTLEKPRRAGVHPPSLERYSLTSALLAINWVLVYIISSRKSIILTAGNRLHNVGARAG